MVSFQVTQLQVGLYCESSACIVKKPGLRKKFIKKKVYILTPRFLMCYLGFFLFISLILGDENLLLSDLKANYMS